MSDSLPHNWASGTLGEAVEIVRGISFPSGDKKFEPAAGLIACLRTTNVQRDVEWADLWYVPEKHVRRREQEVQVGDILISTANSLELVGKVAPVRYLPDRATLGAFISLLRPSGLLSPEFVYYQVTAAEYQSAIRSTASTTTNISNVSTERLRSLPFCFAPMAEQSRIVAEIEKQVTRLDAAVAALKRVQSNLKRYRAAVLKAACEGHLVPVEAEIARKESRSYETGEQLLARILKERRAKWEAAQLAKMRASSKPPKNDEWKKKYKEPDPPETSDSPPLPEGWTWANLDQLKLFSIYGPRFSSDDYSDAGTIVLRTTDISESGKVDLSSAPRLELTSNDLAKYRLTPGDLVFTRTGATIGKTAIFDDDVQAIPGAYLIHFRLTTLTTTAWYTYRFFQSVSGQSRLLAGRLGIGQPNLNAPTIEGIPIPLPPLPEQQRILAAIDAQLTTVEKEMGQVSELFRKCDRLRQSILKRAFEGKLVPQDPNDEPASVLLERIRAERATRSAQVNRKTTRQKKQKFSNLPSKMVVES